MTHFLVDTYHGPLVFVDCGDRWMIASPYRPPEIYDGRIPNDCLRHAARIAARDLDRVLGRERGSELIALGRDQPAA